MNEQKTKSMMRNKTKPKPTPKPKPNKGIRRISISGKNKIHACVRVRTAPKPCHHYDYFYNNNVNKTCWRCDEQKYNHRRCRVVFKHFISFHRSSRKFSHSHAMAFVTVARYSDWGKCCEHEWTLERMMSAAAAAADEKALRNNSPNLP